MIYDSQYPSVPKVRNKMQNKFYTSTEYLIVKSFPRTYVTDANEPILRNRSFMVKNRIHSQGLKIRVWGEKEDEGHQLYYTKLHSDILKTTDDDLDNFFLRYFKYLELIIEIEEIYDSISLAAGHPDSSYFIKIAELKNHFNTSLSDLFWANMITYDNDYKLVNYLQWIK